jgi:hypothetical protein
VEFLRRFRSIHQSAEHLDWLAAHREHPLDTAYTMGLIMRERLLPAVCTAGGSSPVARQAHNLKAAGSNPAPATNFQLANQGACSGKSLSETLSKMAGSQKSSRQSLRQSSGKTYFWDKLQLGRKNDSPCCWREIDASQGGIL